MAVGIIQDLIQAKYHISPKHKNLVTGILKMTINPITGHFCRFPAASIFKIITSAAGIDSGKLTPNSNFISEQKRYMKVWKAFAASHNGVFGRMARQIGRET